VAMAFMMSTSMNLHQTHPHHDLHHSTLVLTRQSILAQSSRVSTQSNYGRQFFVLATNGMYSHSSNPHCQNQVQILYSQPLSTSLLHCPDLSSFGTSYFSNIFALYCFLIESKTVPIPTKSKTVSHDTRKSLPTPAKPQSSKPKVSCPLAVLLIITLVLLPIPLILFPPLIQIKLALYQHPCNNLWTDGLL
jgi:hypothetical protein